MSKERMSEVLALENRDLLDPHPQVNPSELPLPGMMRILERQGPKTTTLIRTEHGALSDVLAEILGHLRGRYYGCFHSGPQEDLHRQADGCLERLMGHLRNAEETLSPSIRMDETGSTHDLEELEKDHRILGLYARFLAIQIRDEDGARAYGVARSFLAVLLHHIRRESGGGLKCAHALEVLDAERLRAVIDRRCSPQNTSIDLNEDLKRTPRGVA